MDQLPAGLTAALHDRYLIEGELGRGGMAVVYLAQDLQNDRKVAIKVLRPELAAILGAERFLKEIAVTAKLQHPHILPLFDSGILPVAGGEAADGAGGRPYYIMPYVEGESLRTRLERERQLPLDEALRIARDVASALDYAHAHGVVHRDIKPENILLTGGEAVVADFGIAYAVGGSGGARLTETGLVVGTPNYMSPEQAAGEARLDGRSDVYSLAAVWYEMLAGEPVVSGATLQAIVARLLTDRPTPLRALRDGVPEPLSRAIDKALAKAPADRFSTAGALITAADAALESADTAPDAHASAWKGRSRLRRTALWLGGAVATAAVAVLAARTGVLHHRPRTVALGERTQLTTSANVLQPAISGDGKQLAYFVEHCGDHGCTFDLEVQDVGGTAARTVLAGLSAEYGLDWSPDRRNLLVMGTLDRRWGTYLVSALGSPPRFVGAGVAGFFAGGDSLLVAPPIGQDSAFRVRVTTLGGDVRDSIAVAGSGSGIGRVLAVPGTPWILVEVRRGPSGDWETVNRQGQVASHLTSGFGILAGREGDDALWLAGSGGTVLRVPVDPGTGRFGAAWDTIPGPISDFSVTADGRSLVMNQGTSDYGVWRLAFADLLAGRLPDSLRIARASAPLQVEISPDGARLRWIREAPAAAGGATEQRIAVTPYAGTGETPINVSGELIGAYWSDSVTLAVGARQPGGRAHLTLVDARNGRERAGSSLVTDSNIVDFTPVQNGWSYISAAGDRVEVRQGERRREFPKPPWVWTLGQMVSDSRGQVISYLGWGSSLEDSLEVGVISLRDNSNQHWASIFAENAGTAFLPDGSILLLVFDAQRTVTLYRLRGPGRVERLGTVPRPVSDLSVASDLTRAVVMVQDYRADAWSARVEVR